MSWDEILYGCEDVEPIAYNRAEAKCPICTRRIIVQWDSDGRTMLHCYRCAAADILIALGIGLSALTPPGVKPKAWPRHWWAIPPRYPGAQTPMAER